MGTRDPRRLDRFVPLPILSPPSAALRVDAAQRFDLLGTPLGRVLAGRFSRPGVQCLLAGLAAVVVWDGLQGPQAAPLNLAGTLPWIHWRGLLVIGLIAAGNWFCWACPFTLPRWLARRLLAGGRAWPPALQNKWPAIALLGLFFWAYEVFALWDSPWLTAWIVIGYFSLAFVIDGWFRGAAFCRYVCPIGQFNFVQSLVSPLTVAIRSPAACSACRTHECLAGSDRLPGCQLDLFLPAKSGNMNCTFCLDCARACPHDNVGLFAVVPLSDLASDRRRSGIGRFSRRIDLAALVLVLVFAAFANAAGMVGPIVAWQDRWQARLGWDSPFWLTTALAVGTLVFAPLLAAAGCALASRHLAGLTDRGRPIAARFAFALVPLGAAMWVAHFGFHLATSWTAVFPAAGRLAAEVGLPLGTGAFVPVACCRAVGDWLPKLEILLLDVGLLASLYSGYRIARGVTPGRFAAVRALGPWAVLTALLFAAGVWIVLQPMQMRGTLEPADATPMAGAVRQGGGL